MEQHKIKASEKQPAKKLEGRNWAKGQSGNPKGRPKKEICIPDILSKIGLQTITIKGKTFTKRELMLKRVYDMAMSGEAWAVNFIADRTEGKVKEFIQTEDVTPNRIVFEVVQK